MINSRGIMSNSKQSTRNKLRRKRRHARQLESRLKNECERYYNKMNNYEYDTWLSQVSAVEERDNIYGEQIKKKEHMLKDLVYKKSMLKGPSTKRGTELCVEYDIIEYPDLDTFGCLLM